MKPDETPAKDYTQPVAYDAEGRPLYAHPPRLMTKPAVQQVVHVARSMEPVAQVVGDETRKKHERAARLYPTLNLSEGEYVINAVRRHPIGLVLPLVIGVLLITVALTVLTGYPAIADALDFTGSLASTAFVALPILIFCAFVGIGMFVVYYVYVNNKFFLTNESVIQEIQVSLFSRHEQTVSLGNIEDASYTQHGIIQQIFNYGSIRLSTEGDETTYRFTYVASPKQHIATLNNAVEAFKNGRPVDN